MFEENEKEFAKSDNLVGESEAINIEFFNLQYSASQRKKNYRTEILRGLSGKFYAGRMCAILGPSGAGKSSLLNVLSGFKTSLDDGEILINGNYCTMEEFRKKSCYILQDFALFTKLTALETLRIAADLKLPAKVAKEDKMKRVQYILRILGLKANSDTRVDHLSGGECKRLSIGLELLTNPPVMFLDEPTSGLDSVSAVQVVSHLRDLARTGRNVVCVIHQPSSRLLEFFDDIYVISHGQCLYSGALDGLVEEFKGVGFECPQFYNRADFALEVAAGERPGNLNALLEKAKQKIRCVSQEESQQNGGQGYSEKSEMLQKPRRSQSESSDKYTISQWRQFCVLLRRSFTCISREIMVTHLKIFTNLIVGLLIGSIYYNVGNDGAKVNANISLIFFTIIFIFFANSVPIVLLYPSESKIFYREYLNNWYGFLPYVYSKILAEAPCLIISTFATLIPIYYLSNQPMELQRFLLFTNIYILTVVLALFAGLAVGAQFGTQMGIFIIPGIGLPLIVFSGFLIHFSELPAILQPVTFFPFFRYIFEASFHAIYSFGRQNLECHQIFCYFRSVQKILEFMDMQKNTYLLDVLGIVVWILSFKILFFVALKLKIRKFTM